MKLYGLGVVALLCGTARADSVGVVVTGEREPAEALYARIERWVTADSRELAATPLSADAKSTLANCFVIDDVRQCAAGVVNARAKSDSVVYARVEGSSVAITWFVKKHSPASATCAPCDDTALDAALAKLAAQAALDTGLVRVHSKPDGGVALIDGVAVGATPFERDVRVGVHEIALLEEGRAVGTRTIAVETGQEIDLTLQAAQVVRADRRWPIAAVGAGATLFLTGVLLYATSQSPTGAQPTYRDTKAAGVGLMIGGAVVGGAGAAVQWGGVF